MEQNHANQTSLQICQKQPESLHLTGVEAVVWSSVQQEQAGTKKNDKGEIKKAFNF